MALDGRERDGAQLAAPHVADDVREVVAHQLYAAGEQILQRRRRAFVGHVHHVDVRGGFQELAAQMARGAGAAGSEAQRSRLRLSERDDVAHGPDRQAGIGDPEVGRGRGVDDRHEVLLRVVAQFLVEPLVGGEDRGGRHRDRVPARFALRYDRGAHVTAGAGAVLHHHRLAERVGELGQDLARHRVGGPARHEGDDEPHRAVRILRACRTQRAQQADSQIMRG